jgi:hypothetical protein
MFDAEKWDDLLDVNGKCEDLGQSHQCVGAYGSGGGKN